MMTKPPLNLDDFVSNANTKRKPLLPPKPSDVKTVFERDPTLDTNDRSHQFSNERTKYAQLGLRAPITDVEEFKNKAKLSRLSQPQFLRVLLRAYEAHPNKHDLEEIVIREWR